jgi:hypothetical protein
VKRSGTKVDSTVLLASAAARIDPCGERGIPCRGAYIVDMTGTMYLSRDGHWSLGIRDDSYWFDTLADAQRALMQFREANDQVEFQEGSEE